jgi:transcription initiation factor TFIIIB Brf1 subunit/transcription initiation factor TFIIB
MVAAARVCPMCESRKVRSEHLAPRTLITVCNECQAVCTIQLSHARAAESAASPGTFFETPVLRHTPRHRS